MVFFLLNFIYEFKINFFIKYWLCQQPDNPNNYKNKKIIKKITKTRSRRILKRSEYIALFILIIKYIKLIEIAGNIINERRILFRKFTRREKPFILIRLIIVRFDENIIFKIGLIF